MNEDWKTEKAEDVKVTKSFPRSKTWAVRHLSKFFVKPFIRAVTTDEDRANGIARWRVFCRHKVTNKEIGVCEVAGPAEALPKAALIGACRLARVKVSFDAEGTVTFQGIGLKPVQP